MNHTDQARDELDRMRLRRLPSVRRYRHVHSLLRSRVSASGSIFDSLKIHREDPTQLLQRTRSRTGLVQPRRRDRVLPKRLRRMHLPVPKTSAPILTYKPSYWESHPPITLQRGDQLTETIVSFNKFWNLNKEELVSIY